MNHRRSIPLAHGLAGGVMRARGARLTVAEYVKQAAVRELVRVKLVLPMV